MSPLLLISLLKFFTQIRSQSDVDSIPRPFVPIYKEELPPLIYMEISFDVYYSTCLICDSVFVDYSLQPLTELNDVSSGFHGRSYLVTNVKTNYSQVVVAFRGTDDLSDLVADVLMAGGYKTQQFVSAERFFNEAYALFGGTYPVTLTGHSLGGCLAYIEARKTNNVAVIFDTPGCENLVPKAAPQESCSLVTRYANFPNIINGFGRSCGDLFRIHPCHDLERYGLWQYWRNSHETFHVALVLATGFGISPLWIIGNYLAFFFAKKEIMSILKGHTLYTFAEVFDKTTGYPLYYQKIDPETWIPYISLYTCTFTANNSNETSLNQTTDFPKLQAEEPKLSLLKKIWALFREFSLAGVICMINIFLRRNPKFKWELIQEIRKAIEKLKEFKRVQEKAFAGVKKEADQPLQ